jgi:hypothetical protein
VHAERLPVLEHVIAGARELVGHGLGGQRAVARGFFPLVEALRRFTAAHREVRPRRLLARF